MNKVSVFYHKQLERAAYLILLFALFTGRMAAIALTAIAFLFRKKNADRDFVFFPYACKDNIGTISRFQIFLPMLTKDKFRFRIYYTWSHAFNEKIFFKNRSRTLEYLAYAFLFWKRLFQVLSTARYKSVFFQRGLFPEYYDQFTPYLEKLLCRIHPNVTVDYFDADYERNKKLVNAIAAVCNKITVVNPHLLNYFSKLNNQVFINDLAVDVNQYRVKDNYTLHTPVKILWTGSENNAVNLKDLIPVLEKINRTIPLQLRMISRNTCGYNSSVISHAIWNKETFFDELAGADIAVYPAMTDTEFTRGKVAYKSIEYGAAGLPVVASPFGLSPHYSDERDLLIANHASDWEKMILRLIDDIELRKKLGRNIRTQALQYHSIESTYKNMVQVLLK